MSLSSFVQDRSSLCRQQFDNHGLRTHVFPVNFKAPALYSKHGPAGTLPYDTIPEEHTSAHASRNLRGMKGGLAILSSYFYLLINQ